MYGITVTDENPTMDGLVSAYDCFNMYKNLNNWYLINATPFPKSEFSPTTDEQVYNIYNVGNWSSITVFQQLQLFGTDVMAEGNQVIINGKSYQYPEGPLMIPTFYPSANNDSSAQWFVKKVGTDKGQSIYTIQTLGIEGQIYYLYEIQAPCADPSTCSCPSESTTKTVEPGKKKNKNKKNFIKSIKKFLKLGKQTQESSSNDCRTYATDECINVAIGIFDPDNIPDEAKWMMPIFQKQTDFRYTVVQSYKSKRYLAQSDFSPLITTGGINLMEQFMCNVSNSSYNISLFYTIENKDEIINNHNMAWSFIPTPPQINPTSFQRVNIYCPPNVTELQPCPDSDSPRLCTTFTNDDLSKDQTVNLSRGNVTILGDSPGGSSCMVDFPTILKQFTPIDIDDPSAWENTIDTAQADGTIPTFVPMSQPCSRYGNQSNFSLEQGAKQDEFTITNLKSADSTTPSYVTYFPDTPVNVNFSDDLTDNSTWKIDPFMTQYDTTGATAPFPGITNFLENGKIYYLLNFVNESNTLFTCDPSVDTYPFTFITCPVDSNTYDPCCSSFPDETNIFSQLLYEQDSDKKQNHIKFKNKTSAPYLGCNLKEVQAGLNDGSLVPDDKKDPSSTSYSAYAPEMFEKTDETLDFISFNFILVQSQALDIAGNYSYCIRSEKVYEYNDGFFCVYLSKPQGVEQAIFVIRSCSDSAFNYLPTDPSFEFVKDNPSYAFTFIDVATVTRAGNFTLLYEIKPSTDDSKCLTRQTDTFGSDSNATSLRYFNVEKCTGSTSQAFSFQTSDYRPSDYPFVNFQSLAPTPTPTPTPTQSLRFKTKIV
jgi:hypothetical protein